jgi:hypothetical protein
MQRFAKFYILSMASIAALGEKANRSDLALLGAGIALYNSSMVAWVLALSRFEPSKAYPIMSLSYVIV